MLAALLLGLGAGAAAASGSYVRAASHRAGLDDYPKYELGRNVSNGRIELPEPAAEMLEFQAPILDDLHQQLPRSARGRLDLAMLAGRLSPEQLDAVRYYLKIRYRVR